MRPLIVSCNVSVDGFMAGPDNDLSSLDFIVPDELEENELAARLRGVADTIVVGRQTFLDMEAYWKTVDSEMGSWINATAKVVLSTDAGFDVSSWPNSVLAAGDGLEQVRRLKETAGGALVVFGGVQTIRSLVAADLVDEYWLKVSPVVLGQGSSMFSELPGRRPLTLRAARQFASGMLDATYTR